MHAQRRETCKREYLTTTQIENIITAVASAKKLKIKVIAELIKSSFGKHWRELFGSDKLKKCRIIGS